MSDFYGTDVTFTNTPLLAGIIGVEVTQAIQYYHAAEHLTDPLDRGLDNSIRLVARKPTLVRVYVQGGEIDGTPQLTGTLAVSRIQGAFTTKAKPPVTLMPLSPGTVTAAINPPYVATRSAISRTLNFVIPADLVWGHLLLEVSVWIAGDDPTNLRSMQRIEVDATLVQTLPLRGILISYTGPNASGKQMNLAAPTMADLQAVASDAIAMFPVESATRFSVAGTMDWSTRLDDAVAGNCSTNWDALIAKLVRTMMNDGNRQDWIYYGLLPVGVPMNPVVGCGGGGVATADTIGIGTCAHECGHALGLSHAPCGNAGRPDPNFPAYEPYDPTGMATGRIGEYGIDLRTVTINAPSTPDFMSYCGPPWISLYCYTFLLVHPTLYRGSTEYKKRDRYLERDPYHMKVLDLPYPPPIWIDHRAPVSPRPVISITGVVHDDGTLHGVSVMRVTAVPSVWGGPTELHAQLFDEHGAELGSGALHDLAVSPGGRCNRCACTRNDGFPFHAMIPDTGLGERLTICRRGSNGREELWSTARRQDPATLGPVSARRSDGSVRIEWPKAKGASEVLTYSVQFSKDNGESWNGLAIDLSKTVFIYPLQNLPAGELIFRVLAHDGFSSTSGNSAPLIIPVVLPSVRILHPRANADLVAGQPFMLWGVTTDQNGQPLTEDSCIWYIDDKEVGRGHQVFGTAPAVGFHSCRFVAGKTQQSVKFSTYDEHVDDDLPSVAKSQLSRRGKARTRPSKRGSLRRKRSS